MVTGLIRVIRKLPNVGHMGIRDISSSIKRIKKGTRLERELGANASLKTFSYPIVQL